MTDVPYGFCHCGCGERPSLARQTDASRGHVAGEPYRFVGNHHRRKTNVDYLVDPVTGCWIWQRAKFVDGYAQVRVDGKCRSAHRWMYEQHRGLIPEGLGLDHLCRNRACVNPDHLEPVTPLVNTRRALPGMTAEKWAVLRDFDMPVAVLAGRYGVDESVVREIRDDYPCANPRRTSTA